MMMKTQNRQRREGREKLNKGAGENLKQEKMSGNSRRRMKQKVTATKKASTRKHQSAEEDFASY
jgi:hypothetical protein